MYGFNSPLIVMPRYGITTPRMPFVLNRDSYQATRIGALWTSFGGTPNMRELVNGIHLTKGVPNQPASIGDVDMRVGHTYGGAAGDEELNSIAGGTAQLNPIDDFQPPFWVSIWCRPNFASTSVGTVFTLWSKSDAANGKTFVWWGGASGIGKGFTFADIDNNPWARVNPGGPAVHSAGDLLHIVWDWETAVAADADFYQNGVLLTTIGEFTGGTFADDTGLNVRVGAHDDIGALLPWAGEIYEVRYGNTSFTQADVNELVDPKTRWDAYYELGRTFYSFPAGVVVVPTFRPGLTRRVRQRRLAGTSRLRRRFP